VLASEDGQADIARLIAALGPLSPQDRQSIQAKWTPEAAQSYLPLLLDGHPMSRDFLLRSLGHPNADVREQVRLALIQLPPRVKRTPLPETVREALLSALLKDPIPEAAPYLARLNSAGFEAQFKELLRSGESEIVAAAYSALYRNSPARAFNALLGEMNSFETPQQSRAVGRMLAARHKSRPDGFYLKFARDMSGDPKLSVAVRASGLHGLLTIAEGPVPDLTPTRLEALSFLVKASPLVTQEKYLPYLKVAKADAALTLIWDIATAENWKTRDRISGFYSDHRLNDAVTRALLKSSDPRSFSMGLRRSKPFHTPLIQAQINHPVKEIANAARQHLKFPIRKSSIKNCPIPQFDLGDMRAQMPFFDEGWMVAQNQARVALSRSHLTTAHPTVSGWLAGYNLANRQPRSAYTGGVLLHYDNISGDFETIEGFVAPLAILPNRPLQLGQSTHQFWVVDQSGRGARDISAYRLDLRRAVPRITHIGALPPTARDFSISPQGDLLVEFDDKDQRTIRLSGTGSMTLACGPNQTAQTPKAPR